MKNIQLNKLILQRAQDAAHGVKPAGRPKQENGYNDFFSYVNKLNKKSKDRSKKDAPPKMT
jgi:hypothetical protein